MGNRLERIRAISTCFDVEEILNNISIKDLLTACDDDDLYNVLDHNGLLHAHIDSMIDIYFYDLRKWAVDNYNYIDEAIDEGITEDNDFHQLIQSGQYIYYRKEMSELCTEIEDIVGGI